MGSEVTKANVNLNKVNKIVLLLLLAVPGVRVGDSVVWVEIGYIGPVPFIASLLDRFAFQGSRKAEYRSSWEL